MSQLLSVWVTECTSTGQQTMGRPYIKPAWSAAQSWMAWTLHSTWHLGFTQRWWWKSLCCVCWHKEPICCRSILHPSLGQSKVSSVCCSKTPVATRQHTSVEQNVSNLWLWAHQGSPPVQTARPSMHSAPVLSSKLLCAAATAVKATSHIMTRLPQETHTVCNCQFLATGVGPIMCTFNWC